MYLCNTCGVVNRPNCFSAYFGTVLTNFWQIMAGGISGILCTTWPICTASRCVTFRIHLIKLISIKVANNLNETALCSLSMGASRKLTHTHVHIHTRTHTHTHARLSGKAKLFKFIFQDMFLVHGLFFVTEIPVIEREGKCTPAKWQTMLIKITTSVADGGL